MDSAPERALNYLHQAKTLRRIAKDSPDPQSRKTLLEIADDYVEMAAKLTVSSEASISN